MLLDVMLQIGAGKMKIKIFSYSILLLLTSCSSHMMKDGLDDECRDKNSLTQQCKILNDNSLSVDKKMTGIGLLYLFGNESVNIEYTKAQYWLEKSANNNDPEAINALGMINLYGLGKEKNIELAKKYFLQAVDYKEDIAKYNLGELYRLEQDYNLAKEWYEKAYSSYPGKSYLGLSKVYLDQAEYKNAFLYSEKAAKFDEAEAEYNLGVFFEQGIYVSKDINKAKYWYQKSSEKGFSDAKHNLNILMNQ